MTLAKLILVTSKSALSVLPQFHSICDGVSRSQELLQLRQTSLLAAGNANNCEPIFMLQQWIKTFRGMASPEIYWRKFREIFILTLRSDSFSTSLYKFS